MADIKSLNGYNLKDELARQNLNAHTTDSTKHVTTEDKATWNGKYEKPTTGIPKSDLDEDVQGSLDKANSALQDVPTAEEVEYDPNETHTAGSVAAELSAQSDNIENVKLSTILIDPQGKFYIKEDE